MRRKHATKAMAAVGSLGLIFGMAACSPGEDAGESTAESGDKSSESRTLTVAYWNYGEIAENKNKELADNFMAQHDGVEVVLKPIAGENWGSYYANLATQMAGGEHMDMAFTASEGVKFLQQNGLVAPINSYLEDPDSQELVDDIAPALLDSFSVEGEVTALPGGFNNMVVYYNTAVFDEAGIDYPSGDWDWDTFRETAEALTEDTDGDGNTDRYGFIWTSNEIFPGILPWVTNAGGNLVNEDVTEATADSAPVIEAVTYLNDLLRDGIAPAPTPMAEIFTAFQNGTVAMFGGGRWPSTTLQQSGFHDWDIQLFPTGATYETVVGADGYATLTSSEHPDLAWEFQKYNASAEVQEAMIGTPDDPRDQIPSLRSVAELTIEMGIPPANGALYYDSVDDYPTLAPFPAPAKYSEYESTVLRHLQLIFGGDTSVEEGLAGMQADLDAILNN